MRIEYAKSRRPCLRKEHVFPQLTNVIHYHFHANVYNAEHDLEEYIKKVDRLVIRVEDQ